MATIAGECRCGAVRYRGDVEPVSIAACHRETGSTVSVNVVVPAGGVVIAGDALATDADRSRASGKPFDRACHGRRGSPIWGRGGSDEGLESREAAKLDAPSRATPGGPIRCAEKQPLGGDPGGRPTRRGQRRASAGARRPGGAPQAQAPVSSP